MKRRVRVEFAGAILASLLFVLVIGLVEIRDLDRFRSADSSNREIDRPVVVKPPVDIPEIPDCTQLEDELAVRLDQSRACQVDADCSLTRLECPFQCVTSVSTSVLDELKREEMSFQEACHRCESTCPETLTKWRAACVRQRCMVLDRSIEELEEATMRFLDESG